MNSKLDVHDKKLLGGLFEMIGYCKARTLLKFSTPGDAAHDGHLGRTIQVIQQHVIQMETELNGFAESVGYS